MSEPKMETMEVHPKEKDLLKKIREEYRYGEVTIYTRDGLPYRLKERVVYETLDSDTE